MGLTNVAPERRRMILVEAVFRPEGFTRTRSNPDTSSRAAMTLAARRLILATRLTPRINVLTIQSDSARSFEGECLDAAARTPLNNGGYRRRASATNAIVRRMSRGHQRSQSSACAGTAAYVQAPICSPVRLIAVSFGPATVSSFGRILRETIQASRIARMSTGFAANRS